MELAKGVDHTGAPQPQMAGPQQPQALGLGHRLPGVGLRRGGQTGHRRAGHQAVVQAPERRTQHVELDELVHHARQIRLLRGGGLVLRTGVLVSQEALQLAFHRARHRGREDAAPTQRERGRATGAGRATAAQRKVGLLQLPVALGLGAGVPLDLPGQLDRRPGAAPELLRHRRGHGALDVGDGGQ